MNADVFQGIEPLTDILASLLKRLIELQERLGEAIGEKLDAMRRADMTGMVESSHQEGVIVSQISKTEAQRKEVVSRLCEALKIPIPTHVEQITLRILSQHLNASLRGQLTPLGDRLRERMLKVAESNRVVEMVCREMLDHFKKVFSAFTQDEEGQQTYSRGGAKEMRPMVKVLDAVG